MNRKLFSVLILILLGAAGRVLADDATNSPSQFDSKALQSIADHNIFDPTRYPRKPISIIRGTRPPPTESFTLVGTWSSAQGTFAIFDGNSSQFRKTVKPADVIAGYRVAQIAHDFVRLSASSNQTINLPVGTQMRRQQNGPWMLAGLAEPTVEPATDAVAAPEQSSPTATSPAVSDIVRRMMERKAQEK